MFDTLSGALTKAWQALAGQKVLTEQNVEDGIRAVRQALLEADVNFKVAKEFIADVKARALGEAVIRAVNPADQFVKVFHDALADLLGGRAAPLPVADHGPLVLMLAGLQGSGKTTTCAKLALLLRRTRKQNPMLVAADLQRPAAVDQLVALGKQLGIAVHAEGTDGRPPEVCARGIEAARRGLHDVVILDTAGRLHIDDALMRELEEVQRRCRPHGVWLVCDAMLGQDAVHSALEFHRRLPLHGIILTKVDGDARGGAALSIVKVTGVPILFAGVGEKPEDLEEFEPRRMAGRILGLGDVVGLVEKAQQVVDEKEAERAARKMQRGQFDFEDFLRSLHMIRKMGPLKKVLGMLPGVGAALKEVDFDDQRFKRLEAIVLSMTPLERRNPDLVDIERRRRIARGSGNELQAVHDMLKQFKAMQGLMKRLGKGGGLPELGDLGAGLPGMPGARDDAAARVPPPRGGRGGLQDFLGGRRR